MNLDKTITLEIPGFTHELSLFTHGPEELVSSYLIKDKVWEAFETQLFIQHIQAGDCVFDIGANLGYYTCIASRLTGKHGKVFSFEPEATNFSLLQKNINHNHLENVQPFHAGLGKHKHESQLFLNEQNRGDHRGFSESTNSKHEIITILKGDDLAPSRVDFIKMDTQGYELNILKGLRNCIKVNQKHLKMIIEFWPYALEKNEGSAEALIEELSQYEFSVDIIDHIHHKLIHTDWQSLLSMTRESLTSDSQGFINLWLSPTS